MPVIERDGVELFYEMHGSGDPPIVFVHGWTCDHTHFASQAEYFSTRHRCVLLDMRGHGQTEAAGPFNIPAFSDDVAWICGQLRLDRPVVVGHSMGGMIAVDLAASHPGLVTAVAALDSPFVASGTLQSDVQPLITALEGDDHLVVRAQMAAVTVGPYAGPELRDQVVESMCTAERHVAQEAFLSVVAWDGAKTLPRVTVPVLAITAGMGGAGGHTDASRLAAECTHLLTAATVGAGHFIQLEVPDQVNAMLARFLTIIP
jgi:pimeloyl-ACP methyl ester carboxylesterase